MYTLGDENIWKFTLIPLIPRHFGNVRLGRNNFYSKLSLFNA